MGLRLIFRVSPLNILLHKARRLRDRLFPPRPRAQAFSPPIAPEPAASATPQDAPFPERLRSFRQGLSELLAPIQARPRYVPAGRIRKWRKHIPMLARTCADVMDGAEALFTGFRFTGQHLRVKADTEARVDSGKRDVAAAQLENQVLRGGNLSAEALARVVGPAE